MLELQYFFEGRDFWFVYDIRQTRQHLGRAGFGRVFSNFNASFDFVLRRDLDSCRRKKTLSVESSFYPYLLVVTELATSIHFTGTAIFILFVITVQLFANFTGWYRERLTHGKARAGRPGTIAMTNHGTVFLRDEFTDRVWLPFVITALKRKKELTLSYT